MNLSATVPGWQRTFTIFRSSSRKVKSVKRPAIGLLYSIDQLRTYGGKGACIAGEGSNWWS